MVYYHINLYDGDKVFDSLTGSRLDNTEIGEKSLKNDNIGELNFKILIILKKLIKNYKIYQIYMINIMQVLIRK